jgi:hypothetical protein
VNAQGDDAFRPTFRQGAHPAWRILAKRIEQARCFEKPWPRFMGEAILQIAVVVLIRLRMNDNRMRQAGCLDKPHVIFQRIGGRPVGRVWRIGNTVGIEEVNVRFNRRLRSGCECAGRGSQA